MKANIQIISAPSILGLKPGGVEKLGASLLSAGLKTLLQSGNPVVLVPTLNELYSEVRDEKSRCLNPGTIHRFSTAIMEEVSAQLQTSNFPLLLGGDCSVLIGVMPALKKAGNFGLIFLDAHADFYQPEKSTTGEVADMDLAIVTGHGPDILTDIDGLKPYVEEQNVIHIGQRDQEEAKKYGSQPINETLINCFDLSFIRTKGLDHLVEKVKELIQYSDLDGFWLHFDTDVLSDEENPAVDYRLPGGLMFGEAEQILKRLLETNRIIGMDVTIFNPSLDSAGLIARKINKGLAGAFRKDGSFDLLFN